MYKDRKKYLAYQRSYREKNRAKKNAYSRAYHAELNPAYNKQWRQKHRDRVRRYDRSSKNKKLAEIWKALGAKCVRCGEDDGRVLQLDHIKADGYLERQNANGTHSRNSKHHKLLSSYYNGTLYERYQILCANCHCIKTWEDRGKRQALESLPLFDVSQIEYD